MLFIRNLFSLFVFIMPIFAKAYTETPHTKTPIKYLVVIFQENRSFDHYFGIYPFAQNNKGEPRFKASKNTPTVNGLSLALRGRNQNLAQPFRLSPLFALTDVNDPDHKYTPLQEACDKGLMDMFVQFTGQGVNPPAVVMGYYDGNTVTALWNYAQYFAMSDNFHTTNIGQSTAGAINLISGNTHGATPSSIPGIIVQGTLINDIDPKYDRCSGPATVEFSGINVGNLLNAKGVTWGWFQGGFANCSVVHQGPDGEIVKDYIPHHNPFQYYQSTSNPFHFPPSSPEMVGKTDQANHLYDINDFWAAAAIGNVPSVSFLKAPAYQDGHGKHSSPILEQEFLVQTINELQNLPQWKEMAIIIAYDDSGGWYDHEMPPIINQSQIPDDALTGPGSAGTNLPMGGYQGRPGYGFRVPCLVISPWAKVNYVDSSLTDQTSILRFIEDNWKLGRIGDFSFDAIANSITNMFDFQKSNKRYLILDPNTGQITFRGKANVNL